MFFKVGLVDVFLVILILYIYWIKNVYRVLGVRYDRFLKLLNYNKF